MVVYSELRNSFKITGIYEYKCDNAASWTEITGLENAFRYWDPKMTTQLVNERLASYPSEVQAIFRIQNIIRIPNPIPNLIEAENILRIMGLDKLNKTDVQSPLLLEPDCYIR